ncbi:hypothetical protein VTK56DRAFT_9754 [Thermocarpiscus australiensis]
MQHARNLTEWEEAARELDHLEGNDEWKLDDSSGDYQPELIRERLKELDDARTNVDIPTMLYLIRTGLSRDLGGMGNMDLYRHSYIGTKRLVENYVRSAIRTIESLVDNSAHAPDTGLRTRDVLEGMLYARQSFGRSALLLSGGATFGMAHIGVVKTLFEARLLPRIVSGASAGSIVCAVLCTHKDEEIPGLIERFPFGDMHVFHGEGVGKADHLRRLLTQGSWFDTESLMKTMRGWLGDLTFQEAYNRTRRICNICVSSASIYELPRLLNYITAPNVLIWSAVAASCSVPFVFRAAPVLVKDPVTGERAPWNPTPQQLIDGSVDNDLPMTRLAEMFNVNHFIVSQVNPHVVPFLAENDRLYPATSPGRLRQQSSSQENAKWVYTLTGLAKDEMLHRLQFLTEMGVCPNLLSKVRCILSQRYSGDITILPEISLQDFGNLLSNPTPDFMIRNCRAGERATWPRLSRIRDRLGIELALDQAVHALRARVVFSESQVDLRRLAVGSGLQGDTTPLGRVAGFGSSISRKSRSFRGVQQPPSGEAALGEQPYGGRRGSGSSLQLLVARCRKPRRDLVEDATDDESEEDERLEMNLRKDSKAARVTKPRLKRCSKSHGQMRGGKPVDQSLADLRPTAFDFSNPLSPPSNDPTSVTDEEAAKGSSSVFSPGGAETTSSLPEAETSQTSDVDMHSDWDPYKGKGKGKGKLGQ